MRLRITHALAAAIVLSLGTGSVVRAQADTAGRRIPVKKERATATTKAPSDTTRRVSTGEVVAPKDTAAAPAPAPAVPMPPVTAPPCCAAHPGMPCPMRPGTPCDSASCGAMRAGAPCGAMAAQPPASRTRYLFGNSGFYLGVGGGVAVPYNTLSDLGYDSGYDVMLQSGWYRPGRTLGVRAMLTFDQIHADASNGVGPLPAMNGSGPDPKIYGATVDALLKFPIGRAAREGRGLSLYALGGGGAYLFRGFGGASQLGDVLGADKVGESKRNVHKWGLEAGAGMEWGLGPTAVFVESRWVNVFTNGSQSGNDYLRWIPIAAGVTLR